MNYSIEPLNIAGANELDRMNIEMSGVATKDVKKDDIEQVLQSLPSLNAFTLTATLPISLGAIVIRNLNPKREIVRLSNGREHIDLFRDVQGKPGDICVSCSSDGDKVLVKTLNLEFRDYNDAYTDRGLVWVYPGDRAIMTFAIKSCALKTPGMVTELITAAEEIVKTKVLAHFSK